MFKKLKCRNSHDDSFRFFLATIRSTKGHEIFETFIVGFLLSIETFYLSNDLNFTSYLKNN
ncbi:hypothetical protein LEP1GSC179_0912 [Leptospira santarosai str. MOR084]|uniref:Uncharacterized protein n=1 Tax=Leptospira santarosai str. MOR084 TaxID=1049984 RepID=A0A0E2BJV2_9LEPT|nr:hypothetical protein LEP1GSC179_0912 [Leptospira santarosai str. MOR084]